jgi:ankyrin repeat protein
VTEPRTEFITSAIWHGSMHRAEKLLAAHPELKSADLYIAAILGDDEAVRRFIKADPKSVHAKSPPYDGDALNYLGLSVYLREAPSRSDAFLRAATALLDAGADPNTGFWLNGERETALYGACGVNHHPALTRLLVDRGADPRDPEVVYHGPETDDLDALRVIVETGKLTPEDLSLMVIRKLDWHHEEGVRYLLEHGANPARLRERGWAPLHHALARANDTPIVALLLDHGADPLDVNDGLTAVQRAAREGRRDVFELYKARNVPLELPPFDHLLMVIGCGPDEAAREAAKADPASLQQIVADGGRYLCRFTSSWNWDGIRRLLELGVPANAPFSEGDGYSSVPRNALPIHVASWYLLPKAIKTLIDHGADVNAVGPENGATPLMLFALGCTESYWTAMRSLDGAKMLLDAGADPRRVTLPTGYDDLDALIRSRL